MFFYQYILIPCLCALTTATAAAPIGALIGWLTIPAGSVLALAAWRRTQDATLASHFRF